MATIFPFGDIEILESKLTYSSYWGVNRRDGQKVIDNNVSFVIIFTDLELSDTFLSPISLVTNNSGSCPRL